MSNVIKLNVKSKNLKAFVPAAGESAEQFKGKLYDEKDLMKREIEMRYKKGFEDGYNTAKEELEKQFTDELINKSEEFYKILSSFEEKLTSYESAFDKVVIGVSKQIASKILQREIECESIIEETLKNSIQKVLGANEVIIKVNPADHELLTDGDRSKFLDGHFTKIKFEADGNISRGGCLVETEIGNVDARVNSQLNEITKLLENKLLNNENG